MVWTSVGIIAGILILVISHTSPEKNDRREVLPPAVCNILTAGLFIVFAFLIFYRLDEVPIPYHADEAGAVYDGVCLAKYHCDRFGVRFPVYFMNFGTHGSSALYGYLAALIFSLFGYSITAARLPAVLLSLISALTMTLTVRRSKGLMASVLTMLLFCILPFSIMHSRWGLDAFLLFPMMIISCAVFYRAVISEKTGWYFVSGIVFGLTLYSYSVSYILLPIFLAFNLLCLLLCRKIRWKQILIMGVPVFLLAVPLMLMLAVNNGFIPEIRTRFFSVPKLQTYGVSDFRPKNLIDNLSFTTTNVFYRMLVDDMSIIYVIRQFGSMYFISIPLIFYGSILCIKRSAADLSAKLYGFDFMMIVLFFSTLLINLFMENNNVNRLCAIYIPLMYFLMLALLEIMNRNKILALITTSIYLVIFCFFIRYYFTDFEKELDTSPLVGSITDLGEALTFAESVNQKDELIYMLDPLYTYVYVLLIKDMDPFTFNRIKVLSYDKYVKMVGNYRFRLDAVMPECIYIFRDRSRMPENLDDMGFLTRKFGSFWVYYPEF